MKPGTRLKHEFVEYIPSRLEEGTLYVSLGFATVVHKCCCGCGNEVVTPLSPTDWKITFDGETISIDPSIGNWSFDCKSHYVITNGKVRWADRWSQKQIEAERMRDRRAKKRYFDDRSERSFDDDGSLPMAPELTKIKAPQNLSLWSGFKRWWSA